MNKQEVFNKVWERAKDKRRATEGVAEIRCLLRADRKANSLACFIGVLIPNEQYTPDMEDIGFMQLLRAIQKEDFFMVDYHFFLDIRSIHDSNSPHMWDTLLRELAARYKLTVPK